MVSSVWDEIGPVFLHMPPYPLGDETVDFARVCRIQSVIGQCNIAHDKRSNTRQPNLFNAELVLADLENGYMFGFGLALTQTGSHGRPWLADMEMLLWIVNRVDEALVLVAPDDKVDKVVQEIFWDVVLGPMHHSIHKVW